MQDLRSFTRYACIRSNENWNSFRFDSKRRRAERSKTSSCENARACTTLNTIESTRRVFRMDELTFFLITFHLRLAEARSNHERYPKQERLFEVYRELSRTIYSWVACKLRPQSNLLTDNRNMVRKSVSGFRSRFFFAELDFSRTRKSFASSSTVFQPYFK